VPVDEFVQILHQIHDQEDHPESYQTEQKDEAKLSDQIFI
jgi:hypothetical protein